MKLLRAWLLILMLAVGHAHACHLVWRLPSGQSCGQCPQVRTQQEVGAKHSSQDGVLKSGDCRNCCKLTHCNDEPESAKAVFVAPTMMVMARIEPVLVLPLPPVITRDPISSVVALHLPNAPPIRHSARAPPFPLG